MQQLVSVAMDVCSYAASDPHEVVGKPECCGQCGGRQFARHGTYERGLRELSKIIQILVARFLCLDCRRTTSRLPDFALSYRLMALPVVERFFQSAPDVRANFSQVELLARYWRRWVRWCPELLAHIGGALGRIRSREPCGVWKELGERTRSHTAANYKLIAVFGLSLLGQYRIHARTHRTNI
jgi:hypothetical protein